jgi:hypothetical protein
VIPISTMIIGGVCAAADPGRAGQAGAPIAGGVREVASSGRFGQPATPLVAVGWTRAAAGSRRTCTERAVTGAAA